MGEEQLLSIEEAMKELQIERDQLKELLRQNALRYILDEGKIKIPKMALMALKLERMTSSTRQFAEMKRGARRKKETTTAMSVPEDNLLSGEEVMQKLQIDQKKLDELLTSKRLRSVIVEGKAKIPQSSLNAFLVIGFSSLTSAPSKLQKNKPPQRRVY